MGWLGVIVILASWKDHLIRIGENLVQHPSNYISIYTIHGSLMSGIIIFYYNVLHIIQGSKGIRQWPIN